RLYGEGDWRTTDARLAWEDLQTRAKLRNRDRRRLLQAEALNGQVVVLWQQGRSKEALPLAERALAIRLLLLGPRHVLVALSLLNLGAQHKPLGQHRRAEQLYRQALRLHEEVLGKRHPHYASNLNNLATLYMEMGDSSRARPLSEQALKLTG